MNYVQAIEYLDKYNRSRIKPGLDRIERLMELLGNPHIGQKIVHVAGTNGKGSTCKYIENILSVAGYSVGIFTSPFLVKINENIRLNGQDISDANFAIAMSEIAMALDSNELLKEQVSRFEIITALGLLYFKGRCDIVVLEVGLGGLYDSTNVIVDPIVSVITKISYDHTEYLGHDIARIASEKAGIIKPNCPVVLSPQQYSQVLQVVQDKASECNSQLIMVGIDNTIHVNQDLSFSYCGIDNIKPKLNGRHQLDNAATAVQVALLLTNNYAIAPVHIQLGIELTYWPCRIEQISNNPVIYMDGAHNVDGALSLVNFLNSQYFDKKITFVFGILKDKDYTEIVSIIAPIAKKVYTVTPDSPRALDCHELADSLIGHGVSAIAYDSLNSAIVAMLQESEFGDIVVVFGSLYMVGYAKEIIINLKL